ncbi:MAG: hypothetical protein J4472_03120 [DPANN group archaeon]|nr:hypothetical protein [DPANN group archaeon]
MVTVEIETRFGDLEMLVAIDPFDKALAALQRENATLATAQQFVKARIVAGPDPKVSQYGSWVAENFVYFPSGKILVTHAENSPILKHPAEATEAHRNGIEFHISEEEAASLKELAKSGEVYTLKKNKNYDLPIKKFAKDGLVRFIFGDTTADYANFLQEAGINEVPVWLADSRWAKAQKVPFARALWLHNVNNWSGLGGDGGNLYNYRRTLGVRKASDQVSQKTADAANDYESIAKKYGLESPDNLRDVLEKYTKSREALQ